MEDITLHTLAEVTSRTVKERDNMNPELYDQF